MKRFVKLITLLTVMAMCFAGAAAAENEPAPAEEYGLYLTLSGFDNAGPTVDVCMSIGEDVSVGFASLSLSYSENMTLANCETKVASGSFATGDAAERPFTLKWSGGEDGTLPAGETVIASLKFEIADDGKDQPLTISVAFAENEPPTDPAGTSVADKLTVMPELTFTYAEAAPAFLCPASVADVNGDGKVNLMDVSLMMKNIAGWTDAVLDGDLGDVVNDGKINLNDVSLMLKHIAGWNSVRLGHNDKAEVIKAPTCREEGESHLTCAVCGSEETVHPPKVPCDYRKTVVTEPTCGKDGEDKYTCTMCGDAYTRTVKATGDHQYYKKVTKEPTCVKKGEEKYTCKVCVDSYTKPIKATGNHEYELGKCKVCEKAHPDYNGCLNAVKLKKYCSEIKKKGTPTEDGGYAIFLDTYSWMYFHYYYPDSNEFIMNTFALSEDESLLLTTLVYVPMNKDVYEYSFDYAAIEIETGEVHFSGGGRIDPSTYADKAYVDFDVVDTSVSNVSSYLDRNRKTAYALIDQGIAFFSHVLGDPDFTMEGYDFGFAGW